jgi:hypothetical protein
MHNDGLQKEFKSAIQEDQHCLRAAPVPGAIEVVYCEHERVDRLHVKRFAFLSHNLLIGDDRSQLSYVAEQARSALDAETAVINGG